ncbi:phage portal protein [Limobrevibacterium gyesilva]|uniref:Phage portal protein n=1 Tax=Limobrevibacterium gyesilva TaxID=2991712 RepID=A0AA42CK86_9PROT|nr:phage portal protein [Limobrevibacterium gyesilva]MCW3477662.1 phage portal protein [Limobrevibacterium gyesilva]
MFDTICDLIPVDPAYPQRVRRLDILTRVLEGRLYDVLPYQFHEERGAGGEYIPLRQRRPSVRYPLARIVVDDSLALVFSDGHFPTLDCADKRVRTALADLGREAALNEVMLEAALRGSVGSVAILMRVLRGRVFFGVLQSLYLTPEWDPQEPDTLLRVTERYKVTGAVLAAQGYDDVEPQAEYWFMRQWGAQAETWFRPWPVAVPQAPVEDAARSVRHGLGFVPIVWVRNLPGGDDVDGACTFRAAVETTIEIDYQLSQAGRGLKYSSDPTLLIREPAGSDNEIVRGGGNALVVSEKGDAKLLEIGGTASAAVIEYVRTLREFALEGVHGNRASAERLTAAQSGRALEMMNQGLVWLADNLRVSYGGALLRLARMVIRASNLYRLRTHGEALAPIDPGVRLTLNWPRWYAPTAEDRERDARTLQTLAQAGQISRLTAVKSIADVYHIDDVAAEIERIASERTA